MFLMFVRLFVLYLDTDKDAMAWFPYLSLSLVTVADKLETDSMYEKEVKAASVSR